MAYIRKSLFSARGNGGSFILPLCWRYSFCLCKSRGNTTDMTSWVAKTQSTVDAHSCCFSADTLFRNFSRCAKTSVYQTANGSVDR
ncbi:hypothetical protein P879_00624 [Paragonimus westermani]|uniref:Uncharacterized protein n=1 Tax=Paragonimus westermani TaxID=34504 RepID=A0A8T0DXW1_9TREM|nr:hypothetical protein P879_00624 [Paragonimus westermani]